MEPESGFAIGDRVVQWLVALGGIFGVGTLLNRWLSRRREAAEAQAAEAEADRKVSEAWRDYAEKLESRLASIEQELRGARSELERVLTENRELRFRVASLEAELGHRTGASE